MLFAGVETLSRKPGTSWCGIRDLLTAQTRHWISFSSQGRQASPDIKPFFFICFFLICLISGYVTRYVWLCWVDLAGFGILWVLQITFWKEETEEKSKLEACPNLPTHFRSPFSWSTTPWEPLFLGPLPEGIEERCPKSWPWTKFCHESVYY